jgi:hypothetical protein
MRLTSGRLGLGWIDRNKQREQQRHRGAGRSVGDECGRPIVL